MPIPDDITKGELLALLKEYNKYIQDANDEQKYDTGWRPVCIDEFYDNEWSEFKEDEKLKGNDYEAFPDFEKGYNILMDYWDDLPEEGRQEIHDKLNKVNC